MATRLTKRQTDSCRDKIQASMLINRLQDHIAGKIDLSSSQVRGIEILLNKSLPSLQATELDATVNTSDAASMTDAQLVAIASSGRKAG